MNYSKNYGNYSAFSTATKGQGLYSAKAFSCRGFMMRNQ